MADEIVKDVSTPAASTAAPTAEAAITPAAIVVEAQPTPQASVVETKSESSAEVKPEEVPSEPKKVETLLGADKKTEEKPTEIKPEEKIVDAPKAEEIVVPTFEPFTLPENVTVDNDKLAEFTKTLGDFELKSKAPHEEMQALGQSLIDRHLAEMQRYTESLTSAWNKQKNDWKESFLKDPEFANRTNTVVNAAIDTIGIYAGDAKQQQEFRELMETTGVGNHPAMIRLLSNIKLAKPEPKQLAAPLIAPKATNSKIQKMYGKKSGS